MFFLFLFFFPVNVIAFSKILPQSQNIILHRNIKIWKKFVVSIFLAYSDINVATYRNFELISKCDVATYRFNIFFSNFYTLLLAPMSISQLSTFIHVIPSPFFFSSFYKICFFFNLISSIFLQILEKFYNCSIVLEIWHIFALNCYLFYGLFLKIN